MQSQLRRFLKRALAGFLYYTGLHSFIRGGSGKLTILMYHSLSEKKPRGDSSLERMQVSRKNFRKQMAYLSRNFNVLSLDAAIECLYGGGHLPKNSVVVTFDDGFKDNYTIGLPVMRKHNIQAIIFLTTSLIGSSSPAWRHRLHLGLQFSDAALITTALSMLNGAFSPGQMSALTELLGRGDRTALADRFLDYMAEKNDSGETKKIADTLIRELCLSRVFRMPDARIMTWEDAREMLRHGISFGPHTMTHPILSSIPLEFAEREITSSRDEIERRLGVKVRHFAYPSGLKNDFTNEHKNILSRLGFLSGLAVGWGYNNPDTDRYSMRRMAIGDYSLPVFVMKLKGIIKAP